MAEGWARQLLGDRMDPYSAGIEAHGMNPNAVRVMREAGDVGMDSLMLGNTRGPSGSFSDSGLRRVRPPPTPYRSRPILGGKAVQAGPANLFGPRQIPLE